MVPMMPVKNPVQRMRSSPANEASELDDVTLRCRCCSGTFAVLVEDLFYDCFDGRLVDGKNYPLANARKCLDKLLERLVESDRDSDRELAGERRAVHPDDDRVP